jgi:ribosomal protein S18 acetylase RimI-like enzyme
MPQAYLPAQGLDGAHPLDNPVRSSLCGPHAHFAQRRGDVLRYPADVSPFVALPDRPRAADWADLAALAGPGAMVALAGVAPPDGWPVTPIGEGVQLVHEGAGLAGESHGEGAGLIQPGAAADDEIVRLGPGDSAEMLDLAMRTKPGPFLARTAELGVFLGIRRGGVLVAMAGERLHPPGWTEISGVCTDDGWRGHGFATRLMRVLMAGIRARGETPFLHALASNTGAVRLYESMGFRLRRTITFTAVRVPADASAVSRSTGR